MAHEPPPPLNTLLHMRGYYLSSSVYCCNVVTSEAEAAGFSLFKPVCSDEKLIQCLPLAQLHSHLDALLNRIPV
jgi:hypothetical protein